MKIFIVFVIVCLMILTGCGVANSTAPTITTSGDAPGLPTAVVQTAVGLGTNTATASLPTSTQVPSATPVSTATPDTDFWRNCQQQNPQIKPNTYKILGFGTAACKFMQQSPDGVYMVYAALDIPGREKLLYETLGVAREIDWRTIASAGGCGKCTIRDVQWGSNNTLILDITATTSGPAYVYVISLDGNVIATLRGDFGQWNADRTAFYTVRENHMFLDAFGVYDFTSGKSFNLEEYNRVKVAGWSEGGIYLSVRPFIKNGDAFCNQPAYAARVDITMDGPKFRTIKKAANLDLGIDMEGNITETPYKGECSELMG